jgi:hypothetical protein
MKLPFKAAYMFRPGFIKPIAGQKNAYTASKVMGSIYPLLAFLLPKHICTMEDLGLEMIQAVKIGYPKPILENKDIAQLARTAPPAGV